MYITNFLSFIFLAIFQIQDVNQKQKLREQLHNETVYPVVRVLASDGGGSGTIIYSEDRSKKGEFETFVLTNFHVVENDVTVEREWSALYKKDVQVEKIKTVRAEVFIYENMSTVIGQDSYLADIKAYSEPHDLALIQIRTKKKITPVAELLPIPDVKNIYLFDKVIIVGCSMLRPPLISTGEITGLNDEIDGKLFGMSNAQIIFGSSGGALFTEHDNHWKLSGVPSRILVTSWTGPITHMGGFIPMSRVYEWFEEEHLNFLMDKSKTPSESFKVRKKMIDKIPSDLAPLSPEETNEPAVPTIEAEPSSQSCKP